MAVALAVLLAQGARIETSLMALLPQAGGDAASEQALADFSARLDRQLVFLVGAPEADTARAAAAWLSAALQADRTLAGVKGAVPEDELSAWGRFYANYRYQILSDEQRRLLDQGSEAWVRQVLAQVYSPFSGVGSAELRDDPLLLTRGYLLAQQRQAGPLRAEDGWLSTRDDAGRTWVMLRAELAISPYAIQPAAELVGRLTALERELREQWPDAALLKRGTLFYANHGAQQAQHDVSTIGLGSLLGVIALMLLVFRSGRPLGLALLAIGIGLGFAFTATLLLFGRVHLLTLVFGASLIGVSIDYALHYLTERLVSGQSDAPAATLRRLLPALTMGMASSVVAYLTLLIAPFPGLQQLAVFGAVGLLAAYATVACWYPLLVAGMPTRPLPLRPTFEVWLRAWQSRTFRLGLPVATVAFIAWGLSTTVIDDDVRVLQSLPDELQEQDRRVGDLTGQEGPGPLLLVQGRDAEQTLLRLEQVGAVLLAEVNDGLLDTYRSVAQSLPSTQSQHETYERLQEELVGPALPQLQQTLGLGAARAVPAFAPLTPAIWAASPVSDGWRLLWRPEAAGQVVSAVLLQGVQDRARLAERVRTIPGVKWIDRTAEWSALFGDYRGRVAELLALAVGLVIVLLSLRYGLKRALRCILPPVLGMGAGVALLALAGQPLTLFSMLALVLVFGIGIDYALFFQSGGGQASTTLLSVLLAALTTMLSFGFLALSGTAAIAGFGLVVLGGITAAFLLAPLARAG